MTFDWKAWDVAEARRTSMMEAKLEARLERALTAARRIAGELLHEDPGITKIVLFGSTARKNPRSLDFDIDLAVEGASSIAVLETRAVAPGFSIDLVRLESLTGRLRENIASEGVILYARELSIASCGSRG
jgi:predicted nucleotidyltransferase